MVQPMNICLILKGKSGLDLISVYPTLAKKINLEVILEKCMPPGAVNGDFITEIISNEIAIASYIFSEPIDYTNDNLAAIVAIFNTPHFDSKQVAYTFTNLISELKKAQVYLIESLKGLLPNLLKGLKVGYFSFKTSSQSTIEIKYRKPKEKENVNEVLRRFTEDVWT